MKHKLLLRTMAVCMSGSLLAGAAMAAQDTSGTQTSPSQSGQPSSSSTQGYSATGRMSQKPQRLTQLIGATVKDQQGQTVGQISDFVVNPATGRIHFAVLSLSDQQGKLAAVPWPLLQAGSEPNTWTANVSKQKLESAQTFDAANWPDFSQPSTEQQIYSYFGIQPGRMGGFGGRVPTGGTESGAGSSQQPDQSNPSQSNPGSSPTPGTPGNP